MVIRIPKKIKQDDVITVTGKWVRISTLYIVVTKGFSEEITFELCATFVPSCHV